MFVMTSRHYCMFTKVPDLFQPYLQHSCPSCMNNLGSSEKVMEAAVRRCEAEQSTSTNIVLISYSQDSLSTFLIVTVMFLHEEDLDKQVNQL